ncbi:MAG TPA: hypothetical protein VM370_08710 [Candidatus Thermoplasmatota archaeon]|nr:hypothetical protein [Candidatus Thermoplasmatota archaeon]
MERWLVVVGLLLLVVTPSGVAQAQDPVRVDITVVVVNLGNYDAKQGSYVLDFYLVMTWDPQRAPPDFTPGAFEFANGRATSRDLQADLVNETTGMRELWYRIQANLYSEPRFDAYPFDRQTIEVRVEDTAFPQSQLVYAPRTEKSGLDDDFQAAGWEVRNWSFETIQNDYSFDEPYSQARFVVTLERSVLSGVLKVIVPPLAFVVISAVSFFLVGADKIATRFALTANMAISSVMFHAGQSASLPSLSHMIFLDRYMLSIDVFLFGSVLITALVALSDIRWKDPARSRTINLRGAWILPVAAVGAFLAMQLV